MFFWMAPLGQNEKVEETERKKYLLYIHTSDLGEYMINCFSDQLSNVLVE